VELFLLYRDILADLGVPLSKDMRILDWGCGVGVLVAEGRAAGYDVVGCDFDANGAHLSAIRAQDYRLPYPDHSIDVVISNQVLEHVMDYDGSLAELRRVLKPGGAFLHMFPARMIPIEPHVFVPGATVIRGRAWLLLWALLGVRNRFQLNMSALARMRANHTYLHEHTNYLRRRDIVRYFVRHFGEVQFVENVCLRYHRPVLARIPFAAQLYNAFKARVVFGRTQWPLASR
jgi:SAM-dependent methyltransferase